MTKQELNRDIKRLVKRCSQMSATAQSVPDYSRTFEECRKEFTRIYRADDNFTYMSRQNILFMLRLNIRHRFVPLHTFGQMINLPDENN